MSEMFHYQISQLAARLYLHTRKKVYKLLVHENMSYDYLSE